MATKNNPGTYDCYANADPDEPMFVLLARDEAAPLLVRAWAHARKGEADDAAYWAKAAALVGAKKPRPIAAKIDEAFTCAYNMEAWKRENPILADSPARTGTGEREAVRAEEGRKLVDELRMEADATEELHPGDSDIDAMRRAAKWIESALAPQPEREGK